MEGIWTADIIRNLNIDFFITLDRHKINFFLIQHADIDFIFSAQQLYGNDVFQNSAVIQILRAELCVAEGMVAEIILVIRAQILFALDILSPDFVKGKRVAKVLQIVRYRLVIDLVMIIRQRVRYIASRRQIGDIIHQKINDPVHQNRVSDFE